MDTVGFVCVSVVCVYRKENFGTATLITYIETNRGNKGEWTLLFISLGAFKCLQFVSIFWMDQF